MVCQAKSTAPARLVWEVRLSPDVLVTYPFVLGKYMEACRFKTAGFVLHWYLDNTASVKSLVCLLCCKIRVIDCCGTPMTDTCIST